MRRRRLVDAQTLRTGGVVVALAFTGAVVSLQTRALDIRAERGTLAMPKDCQQERDKARCAADNRAIEFCRTESDANTLYVCLRANQSPLPCDEKKRARTRHRCERINRIYQPCKGKRGPELNACVDQRRAQEKRKK